MPGGANPLRPETVQNPPSYAESPFSDQPETPNVFPHNSDGSFAIDPTKALYAVSSIKNAIDSINGNEALGIEIDTSSLENLSKVLTDTEATEEEVRNSYGRIVDAEELMIQSLGYSYETYTAAKEAATNTGASLNADINETGRMTTEEYCDILERIHSMED